MGVEFHFGDVSLRDDILLGLEDLRVQPAWRVVQEEAFRSVRSYWRGAGNSHLTVSFNLLCRHNTFLERLHFQSTLFYRLHGTDFVKPRELWFVDSNISALPFGFGLAVANPPQVQEEGHDGTGFISVIRYEFIADLATPIGTLESPDSTLHIPTYMPIFWIPNEYGLVLRRDTDDNYIKITRDFVTGEFIYEDLGASAPSASNYDTAAANLEWPYPSHGFGFVTTAVPAPYALYQINSEYELQPIEGVSLSDFSLGYVSTKGLVFSSSAYGPILKRTDGSRFRLRINGQTEMELESL